MQFGEQEQDSFAIRRNTYPPYLDQVTQPHRIRTCNTMAHKQFPLKFIATEVRSLTSASKMICAKTLCIKIGVKSIPSDKIFPEIFIASGKMQNDFMLPVNYFKYMELRITVARWKLNVLAFDAFVFITPTQPGNLIWRNVTEVYVRQILRMLSSKLYYSEYLPICHESAIQLNSRTSVYKI